MVRKDSILVLCCAAVFGCGPTAPQEPKSIWEKYGGVKVAGPDLPWEGEPTGKCEITILKPKKGDKLSLKEPIGCLVEVRVSDPRFLPTLINSTALSHSTELAKAPRFQRLPSQPAQTRDDFATQRCRINVGASTSSRPNGGYYPDLVRQEDGTYRYHCQIARRPRAGAYTIHAQGIDNMRKEPKVYRMEDVKEIVRCSDSVRIQIQ